MRETLMCRTVSRLIAFVAMLLFAAAAVAIPQTAFAAPYPSESQIVIDGKSYSTTHPSSVSYNSSTGVLTLNNFSGTYIHVSSGMERELTINLVGNNKLDFWVTGDASSSVSTTTSAIDNYPSYASADKSASKITFTGNGTLTVNATLSYTNNMLDTIRCGGEVNFEGNCTVNINCNVTTTASGPWHNAYGIWLSYGNVNVKDSANLNMSMKSVSPGLSGNAIRFGAYEEGGGGYLNVTTTGSVVIDCSQIGGSYFNAISTTADKPLAIKNATQVIIKAPKPFTDYDKERGEVKACTRTITKYTTAPTYILLTYKPNMITSSMIELPSSVPFINAPQKLIPTVRDGDNVLEYGKDFAVAYTTSNYVLPGTYSVLVNGIGNYQGRVTASYTITPANISAATVSGLETPFDLVGGKAEPKPTVTYCGMTLTEGTDYTIGYADNTYPGSQAKLTIYAQSSLFKGSKTVYFTISDPTPRIVRIAGDYANQTSAYISNWSFYNTDCVVIARDDDFADALGATGLAGALDAPIILTDRFELSSSAAWEINRLGATRAYIIGGTGAIKEQVDEDLKELGLTVEPRIWGENSYDTSLACAKKIEEIQGYSPFIVFAMSTNFQDALSMSPVAYKYHMPVILQTWGDTAADRGFTDEAIEWMGAGVRFAYVAGGTGAISETSVDSLETVGVLERLAGETGYDTSNAIAEYMVEKGLLQSDNVVIACGAQAPKGTDALAGAALAGKKAAPILLVNTNTAMEEANTATLSGYLTGYGSDVGRIYVLGGSYVIPTDLYNQIKAMLGAEELGMG